MQTVIITGASSGFGKELVKRYLAGGWQVVGIARNTEKLQQVKDELSSPHFAFFTGDVGNADEMKHVFFEITATYPKIDCLITNAGLGYYKLTHEESSAEIQETIQTNLLGAIRCIQSTLPTMIQQKSGVIITIGSTRSTNFRASVSAYATSKAGLKMYTDVLREEMRPYSIRVLGIYPGSMKTSIRDSEELEKYGKQMLETADVAQIVFDATVTAQQGIVQEEIFIRPPGGNIKWE